MPPLLTDTGIRNAKPAEKPFKPADGGGLFLLVNPTGSRLWRLKCRIDGKGKLLAIGAYPANPPAKACEKRDEAKALLADGVAPSAHKREQKHEVELTSSNTFRLIALDAPDGDSRAELHRLGIAAGANTFPPRGPRDGDGAGRG